MIILTSIIAAIAFVVLGASAGLAVDPLITIPVFILMVGGVLAAISREARDA